MEKEIRELNLNQEALNDEEFTLEGYALTFDTPTVLYEFDGDKYYEEISRGCLEGVSLADVVLNFNHNNDLLLARTKNGTLSLEVDDVGLKIKAKLNSTDECKKYYDMVKSGLIDKMSFAFTVAEDSYNREERKRYIKKIKRLYDVSIVTFPAYESTSVSARDFFNAQKEQEQNLRTEKNKLILKTF